jgi:hypothetical protein
MLVVAALALAFGVLVTLCGATVDHAQDAAFVEPRQGGAVADPRIGNELADPTVPMRSEAALPRKLL